MANANLSPVLPLVEGDPAIAATLLIALEPTGLTPVRFDSGESFLLNEVAHKSGCVVSSIQLPGMSGIEVVKQMRGRNPGCKIVLVTDSPRTELVVDAMRAGAVNVLEVPCDVHLLCSAVDEARTLAKDDFMVTNDVLAHRKRFATLSSGELAVLERLVDGVPHKKIACELDIGLRTVELRKSRAMQKVGASTVADLIRISTLMRLLDAATIDADGSSRLAGVR
jgi:two-component system response regulator FixJ